MENIINLLTKPLTREDVCLKLPNIQYFLNIDPSKNSSGISLIRVTYSDDFGDIVNLDILEAFCISCGAKSKTTKVFDSITKDIMKSINNLIDKYSLNYLNTRVTMENIIIGRNTSNQLYHIFETFLGIFAEHSISVYTYLPMSLKKFIKCFSKKRWVGIIQKEHILKIFQEACSNSDITVNENLTQNDIMDSLFLGMLSVLYNAPTGKYALYDMETFHRDFQSNVKDMDRRLKSLGSTDLPFGNLDSKSFSPYTKVLMKYPNGSFGCRFFYPFAVCGWLKDTINLYLSSHTDIKELAKDGYIKMLAKLTGSSGSYLVKRITDPRGYDISFTKKNPYIYSIHTSYDGE